MDKKDRRLRTVPRPDVANGPGRIIGNMRFDVTGMKPIRQIFIIHPELYQPVENKKKDDQKKQYPGYNSDKDPADFCKHTIEISVISYPLIKIKQIDLLHTIIFVQPFYKNAKPAR